MDVARRRVCAVDPQRVVADVAQLMTAEGVHAVVVIDEGSPVGIVTDRDLVTRVMAPGLASDTPIGVVMTVDPIIVESTEAIDAVQTVLRRHGIRQVPLIQDGRLVGIVTLDDLVYELNAELRRLLPEATQALTQSR
jgi:signal-transduction protein with cAMP-binding, CBS, and nucleotidyltransferase domain